MNRLLAFAFGGSYATRAYLGLHLQDHLALFLSKIHTVCNYKDNPSYHKVAIFTLNFIE
jgi:uncharacterized protein (DUF427 family)